MNCSSIDSDVSLGEHSIKNLGPKTIENFIRYHAPCDVTEALEQVELMSPEVDQKTRFSHFLDSRI